MITCSRDKLVWARSSGERPWRFFGYPSGRGTAGQLAWVAGDEAQFVVGEGATGHGVGQLDELEDQVLVSGDNLDS